jgi:hypothetical protein
MPPEGYKPSYAGAFAKAGLRPADTAAGPISRPQIYREAGGNNAVLANVAIDLNNRPESASLAEVAHCSPDVVCQRLKRIERLGFDEVLLVSPTVALDEIERVRHFPLAGCCVRTG